MYVILLLLIAAGTAGLPAPYLVALCVISAVWLIGREVDRKRALKSLPSTISKALLEVIEKLEESASNK